jgi:YVTN family beta-propeller protein
MRTIGGRCRFASVTLTLVLILAASLTAVEEPDRSPSDLALTPDGLWAVTANTTSDTASLVDLTNGRVEAEVPVGKHPHSVAVSRDGMQAVVTNWLSDSVTLLHVAPPKLEPVVTFEVGDEPRGVAFSADGKIVYVVLSGENAVVTVNIEKRKPIARVVVGQEPWHLALTRDGRRLAVGNALSRTVTVLDAKTLQTTHTVRLRGRNLRHVAISPDGAWAYLPFIAERGRSTTKQHIDRGWVVGNRICRVPLDKAGPREAMAMDTRGKAVGDLDGITVSPNGEQIAVTAGGTHELILLRSELPFVAYGGPDDHIDPDLLRDERRFRRVPLGGRPLGVAFTPDGKHVVVANYLANAIQVVECSSAKVTATVPLGGPDQTSLARRGESIFYDAQRSFNQWYSCHSCHTDGHTNGGLFDTLGDGRYENPKKVLSLRGVTETGPWTWHGVQEKLRDSLRKSFETTMRGTVPTNDELDAITAYLKTLDFVPLLAVNRDSAVRGERIFRSKRCNACHKAPNFTSNEVYEVGLESDDAYKGFNPPSLRGVAHRAPFLHDGRARTLEGALKVHHRPSQLNGESDLTATQLADLIEYLKSL